MKRVAVFAHYDKNNLIEDYVVYFLSELKKVAEEIVFVSDSNVKDSELEKINKYIKKSIIGTHGEYDFGSYKRGYIWAKENGLLNDCKEFILINDSCYAPLFPFTDMFNEMSNRPIDFWGATQNGLENKPNNWLKPHIQSYFIVFKQQVFNSNYFDSFIRAIKKQSTKHNIVLEYEIGLTRFLQKHNFKWDVYSDISKTIESAFLICYKNLIKNDKSPFLKRSISLLREQKVVVPIFLKHFIKKYTNYNVNYIKIDQKHNSSKFELFNFIVSCRKKIIKIHLSERRIFLFRKWFYF